MNYVFDTNALFFIIKRHPSIQSIQSKIRASDLTIISIVTKAELESVALQRQWGSKKTEQLQLLLDQFLIIPIDSNQIVKSYCEIEAFSQGKRDFKTPQQRFSSRNMGKNDLWIAATASVTNSTLITADNDFDHLDGIFFPLKKIRVN